MQAVPVVAAPLLQYNDELEFAFWNLKLDTE